MKKLIIFDMDGTLINSGDVIVNTINFVRVNLQLPPIDKETMLHQINNPDINAAEFFYGTKEFTQEQTKLFGDYYDKNCIKDIKLYDGIKELLEQLSKKYILSVATNASSDFANKMLKHLDIKKYFDLVVGANMVKAPKPSADILLFALKYFNLKVQDAMLIGDSNKDKKAAEQIGMKYYLVDWGFSTCKNCIKDTQELLHKINSNIK